MAMRITLEEALRLVSFGHNQWQGWQVHDVNADIYGTVHGDVDGNVNGTVHGDVDGNVKGDIHGNVKGDVDGNVKGDIGGTVGGNVKGHVFGNVDGIVRGTINGREWKFVETPKDKLQRLITESGNQELIDTFNQMEDNS